MGCSLCGAFVSKGVYSFSLDKYNRVLCEACQQDVEDELKQSELKTKQVSRYSTPEAIELYNILIKNGFNAQLEKWDGFKHIDIAIPELQVNIEVDGKQHIGEKQALADLKRTFHSFKKGYVTLRIPNSLVQNNIYVTAKYIMHFLKASEKQLDKEFIEDY